MAVDNPASLHYFLQEDLYLLSEDKSLYTGAPEQQLAAGDTIPEPSTAELETKPTTQPVIPAIPQITETPKPYFNCLGTNKTGFLILVNYTADEHMAPAHLKALESTLNRKALTINDVVILNLARYNNHTHHALITFYTPKKILILGAAALPNGLAVPGLNRIEDVNNMLLLYTYSFEEMLADRDKAKAFWEQMKNL